jgi:hypothetical protein
MCQRRQHQPPKVLKASNSALRAGIAFFSSKEKLTLAINYGVV